MGDSGATYLGGELDPVHGVLGAVVVGGAPVQVELAEPVGPAERPAPQHCGGWGGRGQRALPCGAPKAKATLRPRGAQFAGRRPGALASRTEPGPRTQANEGLSLLPCSFARFITLKTSMSYMRK